MFEVHFRYYPSISIENMRIIAKSLNYVPIPVAVGLRRGSGATRLLGLWVRIPPEAWMFVCCECCVLSGKGLCVGLITRPEESFPSVVCLSVVVKPREGRP